MFLKMMKKFYNFLFRSDFYIKDYDTTHRKVSELEELLRKDPIFFAKHNYPHIKLTEDQKNLLDSFVNKGYVCFKQDRHAGVTFCFELMAKWLVSMYNNYNLIVVLPNTNLGQQFLKSVHKDLMYSLGHERVILNRKHIKVLHKDRPSSTITVTSSADELRGIGYSDSNSFFINSIFIDNAAHVFHLKEIYEYLNSFMDIPKEYSIDYPYTPEGVVIGSNSNILDPNCLDTQINVTFASSSVDYFIKLYQSEEFHNLVMKCRKTEGTNSYTY